MSPKKVMLSAIKPTSRLTLGNYIGAMKNWEELQNQYDGLFFVVDLHAITFRQDPKILKENTYSAISEFLAAGLSLDHCTLFVQSHVHEHAELAWVLSCFTYLGELNRMTQYKDKVKKEKNLSAGFFNYPSLMAADILLYQTDLVPVGEDQKQHLELTRDLAERFNQAYKNEIFKIPDPYIPRMGARIMDLQNPEQKMSKSEENDKGVVFIADSDKQILKKVKSAVTDSGSEILFSDAQPGIKNLLTIQSSLTGKSPEELQTSYEGKQYGQLKVETAEIVLEALRPIREKSQNYLSDRGELDRILATGAERASKRAARTLKAVYEAIGFIAN